jgi:hypothetical protein
MGVEPDRPRVQLELQPDGLRVTWGPKSGLWGIFREDMIDHPVEVEIKQWLLFVYEKLGQNPDQDLDHVKPIFNKSVGTQTAMMFPSSQLPKNKTVAVQVFGIFYSERINGDPYLEGIYSDEVQIELPKKN